MYLFVVCVCDLYTAVQSCFLPPLWKSGPWTASWRWRRPPWPRRWRPETWQHGEGSSGWRIPCYHPHGVTNPRSWKGKGDIRDLYTIMQSWGWWAWCYRPHGVTVSGSWVENGIYQSKTTPRILGQFIVRTVYMPSICGECQLLWGVTNDQWIKLVEIVYIPTNMTQASTFCLFQMQIIYYIFENW